MLRSIGWIASSFPVCLHGTGLASVSGYIGPVAANCSKRFRFGSPYSPFRHDLANAVNVGVTKILEVLFVTTLQQGLL